MEFPEPVIRVAIEPKTKAGQEKMGIALAKLAEEDPTFKAYTDEGDRTDHYCRYGRTPSEIIVDSLLREFKVEANVGKPQVAYKETIRKLADVDTKYARQSGGKGQYGHVKIKIEPNPERVMSLSMLRLAALFRRNISPQLTKVSRGHAVRCPGWLTMLST